MALTCDAPWSECEFSAVEVKGLLPEAMNFSEGTTSIYVFYCERSAAQGNWRHGERYSTEKCEWEHKSLD